MLAHSTTNSFNGKLRVSQTDFEYSMNDIESEVNISIYALDVSLIKIIQFPKPGNNFWETRNVYIGMSELLIFRVTGPLCGEFTGHHWIPLTKASDAELSCFLWSAPEQTA